MVIPPKDASYPIKNFGPKWEHAGLTEKDKAGVFTVAEDEIIRANWEQFQKVSD